MILYLIRHPETTWNVERKFQGIREGVVTMKGKVDVEMILKRPLWKKINYIYYPGSKRTEYFVNALVHRYPHVNVSIDPRINDRNFGLYEGKKFGEVNDSHDFVANDYSARYHWRPPEGETYVEVTRRVGDFTKYLKIKHDIDSNILCVTSKGAIKCMLRNECNLSLEEMFKIEVNNLDTFLINNSTYTRI